MDIYIDKAFIEGFALQVTHPLHEKLRNLLRNPKNGRKFINFKSLDDFKQAAKENPIFEMLLDYSVPTLKPSFQTEMRQNSFYDSNVSALFFNEDDENEQLQNDFGCIFINSSSLNKAHFLFNWRLIPFTKPWPIYNNWTFMGELRHPCNALIITDDYLFARDSMIEVKKQLDENLLVILYNLLPLNLKIDFHLSIIGSPIEKEKMNKKNNKYEQSFNSIRKQSFIEDHLDEINNYLLEKLKAKFKYKIKLSIVIMHFHDRNILTNYAWINSGNSFTYFENSTLHSNTNLMFQPITQINSTYNPFFNSDAQIEENASVREVWGNIRRTCKPCTRMKPDKLKPFKFLSAPCINRLLN